MAGNWLSLNDDKTELLVITTRHQCLNLSKISVRLGGTVISPSETARNLGVVFDSSFQQDHQVGNICKKAYLAIRSIGLIRKYLNKSSAEKLVNSLVTSNLDYCNSLLYGLPSSKLKRLQRIQNTAARIIMRTRKYDHITPVLKQLHWLPISQRIEFKILLLT